MAECVPAVFRRRKLRTTGKISVALRRFLVLVPPAFRRRSVGQRSSAVRSVWLGHTSEVGACFSEIEAGPLALH